MQGGEVTQRLALFSPWQQVPLYYNHPIITFDIQLPWQRTENQSIFTRVRRTRRAKHHMSKIFFSRSANDSFIITRRITLAMCETLQSCYQHWKLYSLPTLSAACNRTSQLCSWAQNVHNIKDIKKTLQPSLYIIAQNFFIIEWKLLG